jgi:phosphinothricin acetyltransferase
MIRNQLVREICIRPAAPADLVPITAIYNHYVSHSHATFDHVPYTPAERRRWFQQFGADGPHRLLIAAHEEAGPIGYAGSTRYNSEPAFAPTAMLTIYLHPEWTSAGLGTRLYQELLAILCPRRDLHRLVAAIALPNDASVRLHQRFGFETVGVFDQYARKWGQYLRALWLQKRVGPA